MNTEEKAYLDACWAKRCAVVDAGVKEFAEGFLEHGEALASFKRPKKTCTTSILLDDVTAMLRVNRATIKQYEASISQLEATEVWLRAVETVFGTNVTVKWGVAGEKRIRCILPDGSSYEGAEIRALQA